MHHARLLIIGTTTVLAVGLGAAPAAAGPSATQDTAQTFEVVGGTLDITVPMTANLGFGSPGTTITGQLGPTTVLDERAAANASWSATVISLDFTTGGGTASETVPSMDVGYWSGPATATSGNGAFTPGQNSAGNAVPLNVPRVAFDHENGSGSNFATWNPTVNVGVPAQNVAGIYSGTVTHSVG